MAGNDTDGEDYVRHFDRIGVDSSAIARTSDAPTGIAMIMVSSSSGDNSIIVVPGANGMLSPSHVRSCQEDIRNAAVVLLQLEVPLDTAAAAAQVAHAAASDASASTGELDASKGTGRPLVVLNPAPAPEDGLPAELCGTVDLVTPNQSECALLAKAARRAKMEAAPKADSAASEGSGAATGTTSSSEGMPAAASGEGGQEEESSPVRDVADILEVYGIGAAVVTLGSAGSLVAVRGEDGRVETRRVGLLPPRGKQLKGASHGGAAERGEGEGAGAAEGGAWEVVDTTGAGDAFNGALVHALCGGGNSGRGGSGAEGEPGSGAAMRSSARASVKDIDALCKAAQAAGYVASTSVGKHGTQTSYPAASDLPKDLFDIS